MTTKPLPSLFAAHRLDDGRWEISSLDDDYRQPAHVRWACVTPFDATPFVAVLRGQIASISTVYSLGKAIKHA
jgi:hypothetical protein